MTNQEIVVNQLGQLGYEVECVYVTQSPLAQNFYINFKNINDFNKNSLDKDIERMAMHNHCKLEWKKGTDTHIVVTMYYAQPKIYLSQLMCENNFRDIVVGKDIEGNNVCIDFNECPHILIAGTTGAGKSVLMNNIICNIFGHYSAMKQFKQCDLVLIDPKGCEFSCYKNCKCTTFIDDTNTAIQYLRKACDEMDFRYHNMNTKHRDLFIIIDELADLMLTSRYEVEESLVRLAQKGRACGIHLILATQSPRIDVITGLIKANITTRFALKTASIRESMLLLDHKGSETLNGNGDCLVKFPYQVNEVRCQIAFPHNELIQRVVQVNSRI